jgi:asparagine synthase (glutamine-hydrolysing)
MCGICGIAGVEDEGLVRRMVDSLRHRGPDDAGVQRFQNPHDAQSTFLGHTRLSIIDLSRAGHQPMANEDRTVWIIFNGEIYNHRELRRDLEARHRFRSNTDTEVVLHLYEEFGADVVRHLNGMFAFAIYDDRSHSLFLARDHLGIKPLYYVRKNGRFAFGSEIKALLAADVCDREINWQAVWDYFTYLYIPHPQTIYRDVKQLPPGSWLRYDILEDTVRIESYWDPVSDPANSALEADAAPSGEARSSQVRSLLEDAVQRQMISDVPLGAFLSGGIDSSILVGLMAQQSQKRVETFTVSFTGSGEEFYDEKDSAAAVAQRWNTEHHEISVDISQPEEMLELIDCFDQPFGNPTLYLSYLISKATREHVTVAISGAGGDELFAGYPRYRAVRYGRLAGRVPLLPGLARTLLGLVPDNFERPSLRRAKLFFEGLDPDFARQYTRWVYYFDEAAKDRLLEPAHFADANHSSRFIKSYLDAAGHGPAPVRDFMNQVQYVDLKTFLVDNILEYTDRTSMAVALEVRVPFLDYRVVEFSQALGYRHKLRNGTSKAILRDAFKDLIPPENLHLPKKGFSPPLALWMRDTLDGYFDEHMGPEYTRREGIFDRGEIGRLRMEHKAGKRDNSMELFGIMMFDVWYRKHILRN